MSVPSRIALLVVLLLGPLAGSAVADDHFDPDVIRVGVISFEGQFEDWSAVLEEIAERSDPPLRFELALGSYGELLHWMEEGWIDLAVLSPALYALGQDRAYYPRAAGEFRYLATVGGDDGEGGFRHTYRSMAVVRRDSPLHSVEDLRAAQAAGTLFFVFGHPISTSGRLAPEYALRRAGIEPHAERIEYAQSHANELLRLRDLTTGDREPVAFVFDGALERTPELRNQLRILPFPELDEMVLPWDVVVGRSDHPAMEQVEQGLLAHVENGVPGRFVKLENAEARYAEVRTWMRNIHLEWDRHARVPMSLPEIARYLEHARRTQPDPPRIAVVLSGGGAKCSYQVGVMAAVEEALAEYNVENPGSGFSIDLVVGTSGGAINALPVALGITESPEGRRDFDEVWTGLDQRKIIRLAPSLQLTIGLWMGVLAVAFVVALLKILLRRRDRRAWWTGGVLLVLGLLGLGLHTRVDIPLGSLGSAHLRHHLWLWFSQGAASASVLLAVFGAGILVAQALLRRRRRHLHVPAAWFVVITLFVLITLPLVSGYLVLFGEETLSRGSGMDQAMADGMTKIISREVERRTGDPLILTATEPIARMRELSRAISERHLLRRDLVITASCLRQSKPLLPDDLYFYAYAGDDPPHTSPLGLRGVPLDLLPERIIEVVIGSGSIFPVFPAQHLEDFPEPGESIDLIDGGFAHNSPVEAAVLWGATHIILVEASPPREPGGSGAFAANVAAAAQHLARQTAQVDQRSREEVVVFTLNPEAPHPCLLDFSENLIAATIGKGHDDALGIRPDDPDAAPRRRFIKQPGKPVFAKLGP